MFWNKTLKIRSSEGIYFKRVTELDILVLKTALKETN